MRFAITTVVTLALCGCSGPPLPSAPTPVVAEPLPSAPVYFDVSEELSDGRTGLCIDGATVEIVSGELTGWSVRMHCNWDYWSGLWIGFGLLPEGRLVTFRASAPGFVARERTIETRHANFPDNFIFFRLPKAR